MAGAADRDGDGRAAVAVLDLDRWGWRRSVASRGLHQPRFPDFSGIDLGTLLRGRAPCDCRRLLGQHRDRAGVRGGEAARSSMPDRSSWRWVRPTRLPGCSPGSQ